MMRFGTCGLAVMTVLAVVDCPAAGAQETAVGPDTWSVAVRHLDVHPRSVRAARATLDRLGEAALRACGASSSSLREVRGAVRASACWHDGMADVLARIDDPMLNAAYHRGPEQPSLARGDDRP